MEIFRTMKESLSGLVEKVKNGLTVRRDDTQPEMIAVVRLSVRRGIHSRTGVYMQAFIAFTALLAISFGGLVGLVVLLIAILSQFTGIPVAQMEVLFRQAPQQLLPSFFPIAPETWDRIQIFSELEGALFLTYFTLAVVQVRWALRELRWHLAFSHLPPSELPPVPLSNLVQISWPLSLHLDVFEEPSPAQILDLVQKNHGLQVREVIATYTVDRIQQRGKFTARAITGLSHEVTITIKQNDGKQEIITFREKGKHSGWPMLLSFLCQLSRGEWIYRDDLLVAVYHKATEAKSTLLKTHRDRINEYIEAIAEEAGLSLPYDEGELSLLFEERKKYWRLSPECEVVTFEKLGALYEQVQAIKRGISSPESLLIEDLIRRCDEVAIEYGGGYLAEHYDKGYNARHQGSFGIWEWARDPYIRYREMWLSILDATAGRLRERAEQAATDAHLRAESMRQVARCLARSALATIVTIPELERSAQALRQCLALYRDLMDYQEAEDLLQEYVDQLEQRPDFWDLPPLAEELLQETTELLEQFYEHRKEQRTRRGSGSRRQTPGS